MLSVDDNEMNLAVVRGLLKRTQIQLDTVMSGSECMELTRGKKYDLIFMDHMMPDPDGVSTLHRLRQETDNPNRNTPVVALTANAVAGSREEYLRAGFDEYLSKPIVVEKLEQTLAKYLPEEKVSFQVEELQHRSETGWEEILKDVPIPRQETEKPVEAGGQEAPKEKPAEVRTQKTVINGLIDSSAGMPYCGNDKEMYLEILQAYYEQGQEYKKKMPRLYEEKDWQDYGIIAHAIKSTSLTIGAVGLSEQAKQQEMAAKENNLQELEAHWRQFFKIYQDVLIEAAHILGLKEEEDVRRQEEGGETLPSEEYLEGCRVLLEQVRGYEMGEALEQIEKLSSMRTEKVLEEVRQFVHDFDYDSAEKRLQDWLEEWEVTIK